MSVTPNRVDALVLSHQNNRVGLPLPDTLGRDACKPAILPVCERAQHGPKDESQEGEE